MANTMIGMIGLGIMGSAMSANLMRAGFQVCGYDIQRQRRAEHARSGGMAARSARDVARRAEIVITSLPTSQALEEVAADLAAAGRRGGVVIETSTLPIPVKEAARRQLAQCGLALLDAPLSGTGAQARTRDLTVLASGARSAYRKVIPVLEGIARSHHFVGAFGSGSKMKFVANLLVAIHNVAAAEALVLGRKAGLDPALVLKLACEGAGSSRMLQLRGPMMVDGTYTKATMKLGDWQKDMAIIGEFARQVGCPTPLFSASASLYTAAMAMGRSQEDTASVCAVLEELASCDRRHARSKTRRRQTRAA
jgi:L-threonate 2-dehydrogenase